MNVLPGQQRGLVGATLLKAMFERARTGASCTAAGVRRTSRRISSGSRWGLCRWRFGRGARRRHRVHIFWQKRIRAGDTTTPWWFPVADEWRERFGRIDSCCRSRRGCIGAMRCPGPVSWRLPEADHSPGDKSQVANKTTKRETRKSQNRRSRTMATLPGLRFSNSPETAAAAKEKPPAREEARRRRTIRSWWPRRELRDRWLERVNADPALLLPHGEV